MKNNYPVLLAILAVLLCFSACKKKEQTCKLGKEYVSDGNSTPTPNTFYYNSGDALIKVAYTNGGKDTVIYNADTITILSYDNNNALVSGLTGVLDANGHITTAVKQTYDALGQVSGTDAYTLTYNSDGNLTEQDVTTNGVTNTTIFTYVDGNTATATGTTQAGNTQYIYYHNNIANKASLNEYTGDYTPYFGKQSKNLLDSMQIITPVDTSRIVFTYQLDNNNYVNKTVRTYLTPGVETRYFTYSYFGCGN